MWIARNQIGRIGTTLDRNTSLVELNLAENLLGCFKEILNLNRIQSLKKVRWQGGEEMEREGGGGGEGMTVGSGETFWGS